MGGCMLPDTALCCLQPASDSCLPWSGGSAAAHYVAGYHAAAQARDEQATRQHPPHHEMGLLRA